MICLLQIHWLDIYLQKIRILTIFTKATDVETAFMMPSELHWWTKRLVDYRELCAK